MLRFSTGVDFIAAFVSNRDLCTIVGGVFYWGWYYVISWCLWGWWWSFLPGLISFLHSLLTMIYALLMVQFSTGVDFIATFASNHDLHMKYISHIRSHCWWWSFLRGLISLPHSLLAMISVLLLVQFSSGVDFIATFASNHDLHMNYIWHIRSHCRSKRGQPLLFIWSRNHLQILSSVQEFQWISVLVFFSTRTSISSSVVNVLWFRWTNLMLHRAGRERTSEWLENRFLLGVLRCEEIFYVLSEFSVQMHEWNLKRNSHRQPL